MTLGGNPRRSIRLAALLLAGAVGAACDGTKPGTDNSASGGAGSGPTTTGGGSGGSAATGGSLAAGGSLPDPKPRYHPPVGFESCVHAKVEANCVDGWCQLPPSCFVMGSPENEWHRGLYTEDLTAVTLTNSIEVQQNELTRAEWELITSTAAPGPTTCTEGACPVAQVSWWDTVRLADLMSADKDLTPCYQPTGCTGTLGVDFVCEGVAAPNASVYECDGYRLPTRAEAEYAARAGTISTFYSGDITVYESTKCEVDPALELIAWYCHNSGDRPHVGGQLSANGFGLHDMIGNVSEWSNEDQHYSSSPGGEDPRGAPQSYARQLRFGGQYSHKSYVARTASLISAPRGSRANSIGFRLVRTLPN